MDALTDSLSDVWSAALKIGDGTAYRVGTTDETVPQNAVQSMVPVDADAITPEWSKFMQNAANGVLGYIVRKDAAKNGVPAAAMAPAPQQGQRSSASMVGQVVMIGGAALLLFVVVKLAK